LWDWQYIYRIEKWQLNHKVEFGNWLDCIANFDALISFANLKYNNPDFTFPILSQEEFEFSALNIGHPLLSSEVRVSNDFEILPSPRYAIVTGANMAGKSTFLRTIATNIVLAGCGAPVCAKQLKFTPLPLHSSMRTEDSLMKNESYFFIILDEILRGTNSEDKRKGSIGFVKKITQKRAHGLVATHDLELARLAEQQPDIFKALCFEVAIENNQLHFDYKLQPGVTQNMNASFLMKQMGIIEE
jgi:DNA mismatch repair ATPase MutS